MNRRDFLRVSYKALYGLPLVLLMPELEALKKRSNITTLYPVDSPLLHNTLYGNGFLVWDHGTEIRWWEDELVPFTDSLITRSDL